MGSSATFMFESDGIGARLAIKRGLVNFLPGAVGRSIEAWESNWIIRHYVDVHCDAITVKCVHHLYYVAMLRSPISQKHTARLQPRLFPRFFRELYSSLRVGPTSCYCSSVNIHHGKWRLTGHYKISTRAQPSLCLSYRPFPQTPVLFHN